MGGHSLHIQVTKFDIRVWGMNKNSKPDPEFSGKVEWGYQGWERVAIEKA